MSVKIRLRRTGANNDVCYRVVAVDSRSPREGRFLEALGWYDPKREGMNFDLKTERIADWQGRGAQLSNTVASLLRRQRREQPVSPPDGAAVSPEALQAAEKPGATPVADVEPSVIPEPTA